MRYVLPPRHDVDDPRFQIHTLVISGTGDEKEWEIEHPESCPLVCAWWPGAGEVYAAQDADRLGFFGSDDRAGHHDCYVGWEAAQIGLDDLDFTLGAALGAPDDGTPCREWERWRSLPPGRYEIEGWYTPGGFAGSEPIDPDGGLVYLGPAKETP